MRETPAAQELVELAARLSESRLRALVSVATSLLADQEEQQDWEAIGLAHLAFAYGEGEPDYDALLPARS